MAQDTGPSIDPRFDARFQRGYVEATAPAEVSALRSPPTAPSPPAARANDAPVVDDEAPAVSHPIAGLGDDDLAMPGATTSTGDGTAEAAPASTPAEPLEPGNFRSAAGLWIALAASVGFIVVGAGVLWALVSDPGFFMGRAGSAEEQAVMQYMMSLAPGFVQAGVVGIVVVLVAWAARARRGSADGTDR